MARFILINTKRVKEIKPEFKKIITESAEVTKTPARGFIFRKLKEDIGILSYCKCQCSSTTSCGGGGGGS